MHAISGGKEGDAKYITKMCLRIVATIPLSLFWDCRRGLNALLCGVFQVALKKRKFIIWVTSSHETKETLNVTSWQIQCHLVAYWSSWFVFVLFFSQKHAISSGCLTVRSLLQFFSQLKRNLKDVLQLCHVAVWCSSGHCVASGQGLRFNSLSGTCLCELWCSTCVRMGSLWVPNSCRSVWECEICLANCGYRNPAFARHTWGRPPADSGVCPRYPRRLTDRPFFLSLRPPTGCEVGAPHSKTLPALRQPPPGLLLPWLCHHPPQRVPQPQVRCFLTHFHHCGALLGAVVSQQEGHNWSDIFLISLWCHPQSMRVWAIRILGYWRNVLAE